MGNKENGYKKILLGFGLVLGMILVATIIAVLAFFMSIPKKHSGEYRDYESTAQSTPELSGIANPESRFQPAASQLRDPFLPPPEAWVNLETVKAGREQAVKFTTQDTRAKGNVKKPTPAPGKRQQWGRGKTPVAPTASPKPADPNTPEFKEPLILPGLSQDTSIADNDKNAGLKISYQVKKGETLYRIAQKFGVDQESIFNENSLNSAAGELPEGKILIIPIPKTHLYRLKANETLWRIALRYGTTVELLQDINNIKDLTKLKPGQIIILPVPAGK